MTSTYGETMEPPRKRRRPALSCVECRRRKVKCDRGDPCGPCRMAKTTKCTYRTHSKDLPRASSERHITAGLLPTPGSTPTFTSMGSPALSEPLHSMPAPLPNGLESTQTDALKNRVKTLEQMLCNVGRPNEKDSSTGESPKEMRGILSKTRLFGPSHFMTAIASSEQFGTLRDFCDTADLNSTNCRSILGKKGFEIHSLINRCKGLARTEKARNRSRWLPESQLADSIPPREIADTLVDLYICNFESAYRILHIPSFRNEYAQYWAYPDAASTGFMMKMLLVMAIGASLYRDSREEDRLRRVALQWIYVAQSWLSGPSEKSRLNLTGLQVHCLVILARETAPIGGDLVWISVGSLVRTAMVMGLHRDPKHFPKMSILQMETRRRIWSTILEMAIQSSLDTGMSPLISLEEFDTEPPANVNDDILDENITTIEISPKTRFTHTSVQILLRDSCPIRMKVTKMVNDFRTEPSYDDTLRLSKELEQAGRDSAVLLRGFASEDALAPTARSAGTDDMIKLTSFQRNLLYHLHYRFLVALHRQFAGRACTDPRYYYSRKICLDICMNMVFPQPDENFSRLMVVGGGSFREGLTKAAVVIHLELITQLDEDIGNMAMEQNRPRRDRIFEALEKVLKLSKDRIQMGETNIKGFVFLNMTTTQYKAIEAGSNVDSAIYEAAKNCLHYAYVLLKAREGNLNDDTVDLAQETDRPTCKVTCKLLNQLDSAGLTEENGDADTAQIMDGMDLLAEDPPFNFDVPSTWLFQGWDENSWI